jgi:hypothetical protein
MQQKSLKCPSRNATNLPNSTSNSSNKTRNIRTHIRSIRTPTSGVSGPIPGVSPGVSQIRSIRAYTRSFPPEYPKPGVSGLFPGVSGLDSIFAPKNWNLDFWQNHPTKFETLLNPSWKMHIEMIDQRKSPRTS